MCWVADGICILAHLAYTHCITCQYKVQLLKNVEYSPWCCKFSSAKGHHLVHHDVTVRAIATVELHAQGAGQHLHT